MRDKKCLRDLLNKKCYDVLYHIGQYIPIKDLEKLELDRYYSSDVEIIFSYCEDMDYSIDQVSYYFFPVELLFSEDAVENYIKNEKLKLGLKEGK